MQGPQVKIGADCVIVLDIRQYAGVLFLVIIRFSRRRKWRPRKHEAAGRLAPINATRNVGRYLYPQKPHVLLSIESTVVETLVGVTVPNKAVSLYVNSQKDGAKMYVLNADGTATTLNAAFDSNKVLTATAKVAGPVVVTDKAITASSATTGTGSTTNPGTGANDVVGVAAALAVVALVSGAAISLKK